jgi:hypothetical protein
MGSGLPPKGNLSPGPDPKSDAIAKDHEKKARRRRVDAIALEPMDKPQY